MKQAALLLCAIVLLPATRLPAQTFDEKFEHWPVDLKINGKIIAAQRLDDEGKTVEYFLRASGGEKAKLAVVLLRKPQDDELDSLRKALDTAAALTVAVAQASGRIPKPVRDELKDVTGLMLIAGDELGEQERQALISSRAELHDVVRRGGVVLAEGAVVKLLSRVVITGGKRLAEVSEGLNLIPDSVIETSYASDDDRMRLQTALVSHPRAVGIGIGENAAVVLDGRKLRVLESGTATVMIAANERQPFRRQTIGKQTSPRQPPSQHLIDLTQWRREAIDRTIDPFPPARPKPPLVENGALVIVGGGGMPSGLMTRFVELAGGARKARLVYVPCSERDELSATQRTVESWKKMGVRHATFIHTKDRRRADHDDAFLAPLKHATGIWFGGGRQWNFADSYYGTTAHKLMKDVLRRGGVAGGSSAGASIQARYLARATPIGNFDIMAPGYERGGLGFISGVAIDQHFSQRRRQKDMTQLVDRYPQLLGIGIDEATAIIVRKSVAEVVGRGKTHFYDRNQPVCPDRPDYVALPAGSLFDLARRKTIKDGSEKLPPIEELAPTE